MKKRKLAKYLLRLFFLGLAILFVAKFAGPQILKLYIKTGVGDCRKIPILCMQPKATLMENQFNREFLVQLTPYKFPKISIGIPKGFSVTQQTIKKVYYKKYWRYHKNAIVYLLQKDKNFFINLFPQLKKQGIKDDYEFIRRTMYAHVEKINNLTDAFFVIMKGIFIPDLGNQNNVKMISFASSDKKGFINYNLEKGENYFDSNIITKDGFFKIYIKDKNAILDLDKVLAIISTVSSP